MFVGIRLYDKEIHEAVKRKQWFYSIAQLIHPNEHIYDIVPDKDFLSRLANQNTDLFTFVQRTFLQGSAEKENGLFRASDPIGLLTIDNYDRWFKSTTQSVRRMTRKGVRVGLETRIAHIDDAFARSALKIYNETPIRQGRRYSGYGMTLAEAKKKFSEDKKSEVFGTYFHDELVGLMAISFGDRVAAFTTFISLISHRLKYPNDLMIATAVKRCEEKGYRYLTYGNMGFNPGLDFFKKAHGFKIFNAPRYYIPLTLRGKLAIKLRVYRSFQHSIPISIVRPLLPLYNVVSRFLPTNFAE